MPDTERQEEVFRQLHPRVQRWVYRQGWTELRDLQAQAIPAILNGDKDVILAAATAGGKTEAAFLPIFSRMTESGCRNGFCTLYISPLRALINDQFQRLRLLGEMTGVPVYRWHGDVSSSKKRGALKNPGGFLIITPESLEALFVRRGHEMDSFFHALNYVVVDELHVFMGVERGKQLQSLMHRMDLVLRRSPPRIALSATLGDMKAAGRFLRPSRRREVKVIKSHEAKGELQMQLRGYVRRHPEIDDSTNGEQQPQSDKLAIADHLFKTLRGESHLIFANSRANVEQYADYLRRRSEDQGVPNEFFPHHGNLSRSLREELESALSSSRPVSAVCTSTLELGIDIGDVRSIAQIGPPPSVASLRQRLGRSGRKEGEPAILRLYLSESAMDSQSSVPDMLRLRLVQTIAMVELLLLGWYESPVTDKMHISTLIQQLLSLIAQRGGAQPKDIYSALCKDGPFQHVTPQVFAELLRELGRRDILIQSADGTLLLDEKGETITEHYTFYAAFQTDEEYQLVAEGKTLGTLPISHAIAPDMYLVFGGKRWRIVDVDNKSNRISVVPSQAGRPPTFGGGIGPLDEEVLLTMLSTYLGRETPVYLDSEARQLLAGGRKQFSEMKLGDRWAVEEGPQTLLFPWMGSRALNALALAILRQGISVHLDRCYIKVAARREKTLSILRELAEAGPQDPTALAAQAKNKETEKYHRLCNEKLLQLEYGRGELNVAECWSRLEQICGALRPVDLVE